MYFSALFMFLDVWLNVGLRETKKLDNLLKSPVLNHMSSTMAGLSVIRTFGRQKVFLERYCLWCCSFNRSKILQWDLYISIL
jgi:hypothetical protein